MAQPSLAKPGSRGGGGGGGHSRGGGGGGAAKPGAADKHLAAVGQVELENRVQAFLAGKTDAQKQQVTMLRDAFTALDVNQVSEGIRERHPPPPPSPPTTSTHPF